MRSVQGCNCGCVGNDWKITFSFPAVSVKKIIYYFPIIRCNNTKENYTVLLTEIKQIIIDFTMLEKSMYFNSPINDNNAVYSIKRQALNTDIDISRKIATTFFLHDDYIIKMQMMTLVSQEVQI